MSPRALHTHPDPGDLTKRPWCDCDHPPMSEPTTAAGRALWALAADDQPVQPDDWYGSILAIEREAVAAWIASPQAAEELTRAGLEHKHAMDERGVIHRCRWRHSDCAEAILAALRDQRGAS